MDLIINILLGIVTLAGVVIIILDAREVRFLTSLRAYLPDEHLPLYEILVRRAQLMTTLGFYLLVLTMVGAVVGPLTQYFPPIRVINAVLFLWMLAGPVLIGRALRAQPARKESE